MKALGRGDEALHVAVDRGPGTAPAGRRRAAAARAPRASWPPARGARACRSASAPRGLGDGARHRGGGVDERRRSSAEIREVLAQHARLPVDVDTVSDDADLFPAGMSSHASVNVMLGLEDAFDIEFPDEMLKRSVFESIAAIAAAVRELRSGRAGMSVAVDRRRSTLRRRRARGSPRGRGRPRRRRRPRRPLPARGVDALREAGALGGARPSRAGRRRACSLPALARALPRARPALLGDARWCSPCTRSRSRRSSATSSPGAWFEGYLARARRRAAADRLGHLRDRHRRRHGPLDRRRRPRAGDGSLHVREAGPDGELRRATPTTC